MISFITGNWGLEIVVNACLYSLLHTTNYKSDQHVYRGQGGSGIRMPDWTPVGWLPLEARKKKLDFIKFLLAEPFLNTNINFYTT